MHLNFPSQGLQKYTKIGFLVWKTIWQPCYVCYTSFWYFSPTKVSCQLRRPVKLILYWQSKSIPKNTKSDRFDFVHILHVQVLIFTI
jgi:hypothetical protein